jgi:hypothetical protein
MRHCTKYAGIQFHSLLGFSYVLNVYIPPELSIYCTHFDINRVDIFYVQFNIDCNVQPRK